MLSLSLLMKRMLHIQSVFLTLNHLFYSLSESSKEHDALNNHGFPNMIKIKASITIILNYSLCKMSTLFMLYSGNLLCPHRLVLWMLNAKNCNCYCSRHVWNNRITNADLRSRISRFATFLSLSFVFFMSPEGIFCGRINKSNLWFK